MASWFKENKRELPWRATPDPYAILVSEVMLQQTQVATVVPYYNRWLRRFPTVEALAAASQNDVLHAWQGLGYYSRARNLHRCAQEVVARHGGRVPIEAADLRTLPGIGRYTANAVALFAYQLPLPLVEANTARVIARLWNMRAAIDSAAGLRKLWHIAASLVPKTGGGDFQNAMMDLGALVCVAGAPRCEVCPVRKFCKARLPASLPIKRRRAPQVVMSEEHELVTRPGAVLLAPCRERWRGMWKLPSAQSLSRAPLYVATFPFTHHRIALEVSRGRARTPRSGERWFSLKEIPAIPIPSPHRRALTALLFGAKESQDAGADIFHCATIDFETAVVPISTS
ncbi:MAG: A/G-specific adenine glycosylase [Verrucomicrobiota bacterium]